MRERKRSSSPVQRASSASIWMCMGRGRVTAAVCTRMVQGWWQAAGKWYRVRASATIRPSLWRGAAVRHSVSWRMERGRASTNRMPEGEGRSARTGAFISQVSCVYFFVCHADSTVMSSEVWHAGTAPAAREYSWEVGELSAWLSATCGRDGVICHLTPSTEWKTRKGP